MNIRFVSVVFCFVTVMTVTLSLNGYLWAENAAITAVYADGDVKFGSPNKQYIEGMLLNPGDIVKTGSTGLAVLLYDPSLTNCSFKAFDVHFEGVGVILGPDTTYTVQARMQANCSRHGDDPDEALTAMIACSGNCERKVTFAMPGTGHFRGCAGLVDCFTSGLKKRPGRRKIVQEPEAKVGDDLLLKSPTISTGKEVRNVMGRCLDVTGGVNANRTNVQLFECNNTNSQKWTFTSNNEIRNVMGRCLDVAGGVNANRTNVQIFECNGTNSQKWTFTSNNEIRNVMGRCLDVAGGVNANRTNVQIFECNGTKAQKWRK